MRSTSYTLGFAAAVCIACSLVVSSAAILLTALLAWRGLGVVVCAHAAYDILVDVL